MAKITITQPRIIIVEGVDEAKFFNKLVECLNIKNVQIVNAGGIANIKSQLQTFPKLPAFQTVQSIAVIVDADKSAPNIFQSITDILTSKSLPVPLEKNTFIQKGKLKLGVYIMPGKLDEGMLEDLFLESVVSHPAMQCVENYMKCLAKKLNKKQEGEPNDKSVVYYPKNPSKAKAQAFLASIYKPTKSVGEAAENGYWNLAHSSLDELKIFLSYL